MISKHSKRRSGTPISVVFLLFVSLNSAAAAQTVLHVTSKVWDGITTDEKSIIQARYIVEASRDESYALIVDNQSVDRSIPGTIGGSVMGEAIASASYIDKSFDAGDYSAKSHLGMMLLGGLLGSTMNQAPTQKYQTRYTVKSRNGNISSHDVVSGDPFRHPIGVCVRVPEISVVEQQSLCSETIDSFRIKHGLASASQPPRATSGGKKDAAPARERRDAEKRSFDGLITCRIGTLAPVSTTVQKCKSINGSITQ